MEKFETENKDRGAFASVDWSGGYVQTGLTKREYFASQAMSGYLVKRMANDSIDMRKIAKWSVEMADFLGKELSK
jgi:hypothetical protein